MATKTRIYLVGYGSVMRLVRAANRQQALSHVAQSVISVNRITEDQLIESLTKGLKIEKVRDAVTEPLDFAESE